MVEEQEVRLKKEKAEHQLMERRLKKEMKEMEKRAERERQKVNEVMACLVDRVEQLKLRK